MSTKRILIAAGGTGGHVYPAIAIADALSELDESVEFLFVGTRDRMEWEAVPKAGYDIKPIWISGFHRRLTFQNVLFPVKLLVSLKQSRRIIKDFQPDIVLSCGGFAAGPVGWAAARKGIPVVIQEQNSFPGWTNRKLGSKATRIYTAFEEAEKYFDQERVRPLGNPVRADLSKSDRDEAARIWNLEPQENTLLILGGSGGARTINRAVIRHLHRLHDELGLQFIWQCGKNYYEQIIEEINPVDYSRLRLQPFIDDMSSSYAMADLAVSRAGAISCAELKLTGTPSLIIPSPNVAGDHQTKNANELVTKGAAQILRDEEAEEKLADRVAELFEHRDRITKMRKSAKELARPEAARNIAEDMLTLITSQEPAQA